MPVVQKIADIDSSFHMLMGNVATTCHFESQYEAKKIGEGWKSTDENTIKAVYSAVIEFITYYNSNHLKQTV